MTELRRLEGEEMLDVMFPLGMYAFHSSPPFPDREEWGKYARLRQNVIYYSLSENGQAMTGAGNTAMRENVRGAIYPTSAVWGVTTHPSARRKGWCKQTLAALLAAAREAGQVFSTLYPFRESFYERLGYVTFQAPLQAQLTTQALTPLLEKDLGGEVVFQTNAEAYELFRAYLYRMQSETHGMAVFDQATPHVTVQRPAWAALAYVNGALDGFMIYTLTGEEITNFNFKASRFYYRTSRGRSLLLAWIARHVDQAGAVFINLPPCERPETWLADIRHKISVLNPVPMGRVLDLAKIGGMQTGPGSFNAQIRDPFCPWNEGTWRFETQDGHLSVAPTTQEADCALSIQALSALVYGTIPPGDFWLRGWGDPSAELMETIGVMFPPMLPHLHEMF